MVTSPGSWWQSRTFAPPAMESHSRGRGFDSPRLHSHSREVQELRECAPDFLLQAFGQDTEILSKQIVVPG